MIETKVHLIRQHYCDAIRATAGTRQNGPVQYGQVEHGIVATGRARCRCCHEKIPKGTPEIRFYWDFTGSGSWTAVECHIHATPCTEL